MAKKVLLKHVKAQNLQAANEKTMCNVVDTYWLKQAKPSNLQKGAHTIAKEYGIKQQWRTLINHYKGGRSMQEGHEPLQELTSADEATLVSFLNDSAVVVGCAVA